MALIVGNPLTNMFWFFRIKKSAFTEYTVNVSLVYTTSKLTKIYCIENEWFEWLYSVKKLRVFLLEVLLAVGRGCVCAFWLVRGSCA